MGRIFFLITNSFVFGIKNKYMFNVENLETVEECKEENKNQLLSSLNPCDYFGALPSEFSSLHL